MNRSKLIRKYTSSCKYYGIVRKSDAAIFAAAVSYTEQ